MSTYKMFFAGAGGQGILLMGQMITYAAMYEDKEVTFLPAYGPEMRGGTANCTVVVSDKPINCPIIYEADAVIAMNLPSMQKFESLLKPQGQLFVNTSLIDVRPTREDILVTDVAADDWATELGNRRTLNIITLGAVIAQTGVVSMESVEKVLKKTFSGRKANLYDINLQALHLYENKFKG